MKIVITNAWGAEWISKHFRAREFKCPCCWGCVIDHTLLEVLEDMREMLGDAPIHINSGYRCKKHNAEVGGATESQHMLGKAADIWVEGHTPDEVYRAACIALGKIGGAIKHKTYVHVDVRNTKYREEKSND